MRKNERLAMNEIIEGLNKVYSNLEKETKKYYSCDWSGEESDEEDPEIHDYTDEDVEDAMSNIEVSEIRLEEIINKLVELSNK
ncbi:hypothetical protein [Ligilactobacillus salivarius]|uniref:hypothetical protein n=1 Tax=Ligilactobacillus salivarius TaxID=1624 RepID=UPI0009DA22A9|nr:hypothetical protein [Ligilactobacillus salivarius]OQR18441.1 hypothetical protein B6U39_10895 [Ligilactobacillus salivarius]